MALKGIKVIEFGGLAPAPFCGMILADFGADVLRIDKAGPGMAFDYLSNGKKSLAINLKTKEGTEIIRRLSQESDVLLEPFRHGVMERLNLGPDVLMQQNPKLIYARLTGYGQKGLYSSRAGHDINYTAMSGLLSMMGRHDDKPMFPVNITADFGGGGLMCALGIVLALYERKTSGLGQVVDCSMVRGTAYLGSWFYRTEHVSQLWGNERGRNLLDSGAHFYETYETKDGKYMAVGALEPQFYENLLKGLNLDPEAVPQYENFEEGKKVFDSIFRQKTQKEWCDIFDKLDACVTPILLLKEAAQHPHNVDEHSFTKDDDGHYLPMPQPVLSRTPGKIPGPHKMIQKGKDTKAVLEQLNYGPEEICQLERDGVIEIFRDSKL